MRRPLATVAAVCFAALAASGCGDQGEPFRVGVLTECVALLDASEESIVAAAQLPFIERGAQLRGDRPADGLKDASVGGRAVELVTGCTTASADLTRQIVETRRLIEEEGADVVIGPVGETEGVLVRRMAARYPDVAFVLGASAAQEATLSDPQPNVFRFVADGAQTTAGLGAYAFRDLGWRRAAVVMDPFPASWEGAAGFVAEFCALGGTIPSREVLLAQLEPGGAASDRAIGARLGREVDGTMLISSFSTEADFLRAYGRDGRPSRRLVVNGFGFVQPGGLSPGGIDLSGVVFGNDVPLDSERPQWRRHQRAYSRAFPTLPPESAHGLVEFPVYMGAEAVARALERIDGEPGSGGQRLREALSRVAFEGPAGPVRLDRNRQAVVSVHLRRIVGRGDRATTEPFRVERNVDQSFAGAFGRGTPPPSLASPRCKRGPVPAWAQG